MNELVLEVSTFVTTLFFGLFVVDVSLTLGAKLIAFGTTMFDHVRVSNGRK